MKDFSLHILDITHNSLRAGAKNITIEITDKEANNLVMIKIEDDGKGVPSEIIEQLPNPFYSTRKTRKIGLGIPLFKQSIELTGGSLQITNKNPKGLTVEGKITRNHIDRLPMGDIAGVISQLIISNQLINIKFYYQTDNGEFAISTAEILEIFEGEDNFILQKFFDVIKNMIYENLILIKCSW